MISDFQEISFQQKYKIFNIRIFCSPDILIIEPETHGCRLKILEAMFELNILFKCKSSSEEFIL